MPVAGIEDVVAIRRGFLAACLAERQVATSMVEQREAEGLREAFAADPDGTVRKGLLFSWWRHGGEPGPDWLSDKLEVNERDGQFSARFRRYRS